MTKVNGSSKLELNDDDLDAWIEGGELPTLSVSVCLKGDLWPEAQACQQELFELSQKATDDTRLVGDPRAKYLSGRINEIGAEMKAASRDFILRALPNEDYNALIALPEHAPRPDNLADQRSGCNRDTATNALIRRCTISPAMTNPRWNALLPKLSPGQYNELGSAAWEVNQGTVKIPFSRLVLQETPSSASE